MSSNERAPEPTMDEIIASIRRIIADDETQPQAAPAAAKPAETGVKADPDGDADTQIIDDIARVLSSAGGAPADSVRRPAQPQAASAPADEEDDVLDLMDLGEAIPGTMEVAEFEVTETVTETVTGQEPDFSAAFPAGAGPGGVFQPEALEPEPAEDVSMPVEPVEAPKAAKPAPYEPPMSRRSALEDPTAAFEKALAALKAGDLNAFAREVDAAPSAPAPSEISIPVSSEPAEEGAETVSSETALELASSSDAPESASAPTPSSWRSRLGIPEFQPGRTLRGNGGSGHKYSSIETATGQSLEDSVKEMLRPMLQKWLDENMSRVLTQALREELEKSPARRGE